MRIAGQFPKTERVLTDADKDEIADAQEHVAALQEAREFLRQHGAPERAV